MSSMTLVQVRDWHLSKVALYHEEAYPRAAQRHQKMADAIDAHLARMGEPVACNHEWAEGYGVPPYCNHCGVKKHDDPPIDIAAVRDVIPTNWCDPLLTGPNAVIGKPPYNRHDIERLLRSSANRLEAAIKGVA